MKPLAGDGSFDVAIDKGTMDALMCEKGDVWDPPQSMIDNVYKEVSEVARILDPRVGKFIYITFGQPHFRRLHLDRPEFNWDIQVEKAGDAFHYYVYIMTKKQK